MTVCSSVQLVEQVESGLYEKAASLIGNANTMESISSSVLVDVATLVIDRLGSSPPDAATEQLLNMIIRKCDVFDKFLLCKKLLSIREFDCSKMVIDNILRDLELFHGDSDCWDEIVFELPFTLEKKVCQLLTADDKDGLGAATSLLRLYSSHAELRWHRFPKLFATVWRKSESLKAVDGIDDFIRFASLRYPFHPIVVIHRNGLFLPLVYSPAHLIENLLTALQEYACVDDDDREGIRVDALINSLNMVFNAAHSHIPIDSVTFEGLLFSLLPYIQDFDLGERRVVLMKQCQRLLAEVNPTSRVVVIKRLVERLARPNQPVSGESMLMAWLLDIYRLNLREESLFRDELGSLWSLLERLRFEDVLSATAYYTSIFNLAQAQALQRINPEMMRLVKLRVLDGLKDQLRDYMHLQKMKEQSGQPSDEHIHADVCMPNSVDLILFNITYADNVIDKFLKEPVQ